MSVDKILGKYLNENIKEVKVSDNQTGYDIGNGGWIAKTKHFNNIDYKLISGGPNDIGGKRGRAELKIEGTQDAKKKNITITVYGIYDKLDNKEKKEIKPGLQKGTKEFEEIGNKPVKVRMS